MEIAQLRCFVATAHELHFGRAAQSLDMLPAALGRQIRLLEQHLGVRLFDRTTRQVALTRDGALVLEDAQRLIAQADALVLRFRGQARGKARELRIGAIDSAAVGLMPMLLHDLRTAHPEIAVHLVEDKSIRLLPRLASGSLDIAVLRPPERRDRTIAFQHLFYETAVIALPVAHALAMRPTLAIADIADEPMIVPERRSRPHSHDLTMRLFAEAGLYARVGQIAEEKQTIINLVAAGMGLAIVPRWTSRLAVDGVRYVPLAPSGEETMKKLPLSAAWLRNTRDAARDAVLEVLNRHLEIYGRLA